MCSQISVLKIQKNRVKKCVKKYKNTELKNFIVKKISDKKYKNIMLKNTRKSPRKSTKEFLLKNFSVKKFKKMC